MPNDGEGRKPAGRSEPEFDTKVNQQVWEALLIVRLRHTPTGRQDGGEKSCQNRMAFLLS
jgi:hypothetical protein